MLSPITKFRIRQILPFGLIWMFFGTVYAITEQGILGDLEYYPATGNPYNFLENFTVIVITTGFAGVAVGALEMFVLKHSLSRRAFTHKILIKTLIYLVIMFLILLFMTVISSAMRLQTGPLDSQVWTYAWNFVSSPAFLSVEVYIGAVILTSLLYAEVGDNLGPEVLKNFFTGKYHRPIEEERIFMFLDMKSSTSIAESLGHVEYFKFLKRYYSDLSEPVVAYRGEIYQYVGDEIVVTWKPKRGLRNNNCLRCFYAMKEAIEKNASKYHDRFGVVPAFKAGFHYGQVTTGEIGAVKQDIIFTGDVLNTTARIQDLCNTYQVDILVSGALHDKLDSSECDFTYLGEVGLRGRDEQVRLFTLTSHK